MILSHEHRFIFLKTRKTGGTSVEIALSSACGPEDVITPVDEEDERLRLAAGGRPPQNYESPPLRRRAYNHMPAAMVRREVGPDEWQKAFRFTIERNPWDAVVSLYHWRFREGEATAFSDFVHSPLVENFATKNARIYRIKGELAVDRICRYEQLDSELGRIWADLRLPGTPRLPRAKGGVRPSGRDYRTYYDAGTRERVAGLFAPVIAELGYSFDG